MNPTLLKILTNDFLMIFIGMVAGMAMASFMFNKEEVKPNPDDESIDETGEMDGDGMIYYVKLPDNPKLIDILIEDTIGIDHILVLDKIRYKVREIEHHVDGHTIIHLSHTHAPQF